MKRSGSRICLDRENGRAREVIDEAQDTSFREGFNVVLGTRRSQAAQLVLEPGKAEGNLENRHDGADQWLFVVSGTGVASINRRRYPLRPMSLVLIEHGDRHEIRNTGKALLKTLNVYVPPAYSTKGDELPAGEPGQGDVH